ncbi:MAG: 2-phosphosulfolactate phosphatase [Bradymonadaceae bacterium]|nr:2-phosphosulfolactate phosphatase [Lujinxingiaceae bacterium]
MQVRIFQGHTPALPAADVNVVIDVIRAFTTAWVALERGVLEILLVAEIDQAFALRKRFPDYLLVGERGALKIEGFDFGNSPYDLSQAPIAGRGLIFTTTNGVRATIHALHDGELLVTGFASAARTVERIRQIVAGRQAAAVNIIASHPSGDEDLACATWIRARLLGFDSPGDAEVVARICASDAAQKFYDPSRVHFRAEDIDFCARVMADAPAMRASEQAGLVQISAIRA